ncbi:hypothetical protein, partial [Campylobacter troglodytis]|uniref:hypothetical protein n=1 Tax=Campylobacter troglodytis TaxID=654363 RepID=UPI001C8D096D
FESLLSLASLNLRVFKTKPMKNSCEKGMAVYFITWYFCLFSYKFSKHNFSKNSLILCPFKFT